MNIKLFFTIVVILLPFMILALPKFTIKSSSFENNSYIPSKYSYYGDDFSPELHWENIPKGTKSFALIVDDPDAPSKTWVHWIIYNIPTTINSLSEHFPRKKYFGNGITQGKSDFNNFGYDGPAPPSGTHHYHFKLYALDIDSDFNSGLTKNELMEKIKSHIIGETEIIGLYSK